MMNFNIPQSLCFARCSQSGIISLNPMLDRTFLLSVYVLSCHRHRLIVLHDI